MPLRAYRCEAGHDVEVVESMSGPRLAKCPECQKPVHPQIQHTSRPIVKGGTPNYNGMRGVE